MEASDHSSLVVEFHCPLVHRSTGFTDTCKMFPTSHTCFLHAFLIGFHDKFCLYSVSNSCLFVFIEGSEDLEVSFNSFLSHVFFVLLSESTACVPIVDNLSCLNVISAGLDLVSNSHKIFVLDECMKTLR